jgi:hypothetical protein
MFLVVCGGVDLLCKTKSFRGAALHKRRDTEDLPTAASRRAFPTPPNSLPDHHPSKSISPGFITPTRYANFLVGTLSAPIDPP